MLAALIDEGAELGRTEKAPRHRVPKDEMAFLQENVREVDHIVVLRGQFDYQPRKRPSNIAGWTTADSTIESVNG